MHTPPRRAAAVLAALAVAAGTALWTSSPRSRGDDDDGLGLGIDRDPSSVRRSLTPESEKRKANERRFDDVSGVTADRCLQYTCDWDIDRCAVKDPLEDYYSPDADKPPCCADILREMNRAFDAEMGRLGLDYAVMFGSLLGFIRGGDVIPWSNDNDYMVPEASMDAIREGQWDDARSGLSMVWWKIHRMCVNEHFLDGRLRKWAVPWDDPSLFLENGKRKRLHERDIPYGDMYLGLDPSGKGEEYAFVPNCCMSRGDVYPLKRVSVGEHEMNFPADPEAILEGLYGEWRVPDASHGRHGRTTCSEMACKGASRKKLHSAPW